MVLSKQCSFDHVLCQSYTHVTKKFRLIQIRTHFDTGVYYDQTQWKPQRTMKIVYVFGCFARNPTLIPLNNTSPHKRQHLVITTAKICDMGWIRS